MDLNYFYFQYFSGRATTWECYCHIFVGGSAIAKLSNFVDVNTPAAKNTLEFSTFRGIYVPNLRISSVVFTRYQMVARCSLSILPSLIQSYFVARSSYDGLRLLHDKSWQIADIHRLSYDGRTVIMLPTCDYHTTTKCCDHWRPIVKLS